MKYTSRPPASASGRVQSPPEEVLLALVRGTKAPTLLVEVGEDSAIDVRWWNEAAESCGLITRAKLRGGPGAARLLPALAESLWDAVQICVECGDPQQFEEFVTIDGRETWWLTTVTPVGDSSAPASRLVVSYVDIGFLRPTELALQRTEANFRVLIERSTDGIFVCRADGTTVFENPAATRMLGEVGLELGQRCIFHYAYPEARVELAARLAEAFGSKPPTGGFELELRGAEGRLWVELTANRMSFDGSDVVVLNARDVSELRRTQSSFANADSLIALGRMAAGIAHEINNPLGYMSSNLAYSLDQLSIMHVDLPAPLQAELDEVRAALRDAAEGARRVGEIVRDLRGLALDDSEPPAPTSVEGALETALKLARTELYRHAHVEKRYEPVPLVYAREPRLVQVFLNLLLNAIYAVSATRTDREDGRRAGMIRLRIRPWEERMVAVEVEDSGCGISEADRGRLFAPFFTTKPPGASMGLGLTVCHQLVSAVGGRIDVESELGRGSVFRVLLRADEEGTEPGT
jgi:two-component system, NtrC family, sensor kinase